VELIELTTKKRDWEKTFLNILSQSCNVSLAARGAGVTQQAVYKARGVDPDFAARMDAAKEEALDILEAAAYSRARRQSDTLMIFLLKAHNPQKYVQATKVQMDVNINIKVVTRLWKTIEQTGENPEVVLSNFERYIQEKHALHD
jgi:hypothetical protein